MYECFHSTFEKLLFSDSTLAKSAALWRFFLGGVENGGSVGVNLFAKHIYDDRAKSQSVQAGRLSV